MRKPAGPLVLVVLIVLTNVAGAVLLKVAADSYSHSLSAVAALIVAVFGVNALRFVLWGVAHKRYPLSETYPLTSLFFPIILLVSVWYGESLTSGKLIGTLLITIGVSVLVRAEEDTSAPVNE